MIVNNKRRLITLREIEDISPIAGADRVEVCTVGGWKVVTKKGEFQPGDLCFYIEIDSLLDTSRPEFSFLAKENKTHHRLKTVKLKGQISEGLLLPLSSCPQKPLPSPLTRGSLNSDISWDEIFGVTKYEAPEPKVSGPKRQPGASYKTFPSFLKKTDQERIENCKQLLTNYKTKWEITRKLDGSSMTVGDYDDAGIMVRQRSYRKTFLATLLARLKALFKKPDTFFVCSRQVNLPDVAGCHFWSMAHKYNLRELLKGKNIALQGELVGPGVVNGNWEGLKENDFYVFDIWDIKNQCYYTPDQRQEWMGTYGYPAGLKHVPIIEPEMYFSDTFNTVEHLKNFCSTSHTNDEALFNMCPEGYVWKSHSKHVVSFKCINHNYLLSKKD
jgi:RNA ligase (TIGR02306 family)